MTTPQAPVPIETLLTHREWVRRLARTLVRDEASAADLEQRTWLAALRRPPRDASTSRAWLSTVMRNLASNNRRAGRRRDVHELASPARPQVRPTADVVAEADCHRRVVVAVHGLPEPQRSTVLLRWFEDLPPRDIAERMGVPVETVRTRLRRARAALREDLKRFHQDPADWLGALLPLAGLRPEELAGAVSVGKTASAVGGAAVGVKAGTMVATAVAVAAAFAGGALVARSSGAAAPAPQHDAAAVVPDGGAADALRAERRREREEAATRESALHDRIAQLEGELTQLRVRAANLDGLDPLALILYSDKPLAWRLRKLHEIMDEDAHRKAALQLAAILKDDEGAAAAMLALLETETDEAVVEGVALMLRARTLGKASREQRLGYAELLRSDAPEEVRTACVRAVFMSEGFRGGVGPETKQLAEEMNGILVEVLRSETSQQVVGEIALAMAAWFPPPDAVDALRSAAGRLPASKGRRRAWEAIGRGTFRRDGGASLFEQFERAEDQEERDDIAAAIARAANSMSGGSTNSTIEERRARVRVVFEGTSDAEVRRRLIRASFYGLNCMRPANTADEKVSAARFLRGLAGVDADPEQSERIERIAGLVEEGDRNVFGKLDAILSGKE